MENKTPLVTIITPSYMQGKYIEDTIRSVYNQTYVNIEHIIIDACSTDETDEIVKKYLGRYNVKYIREKDRGQANAINKGLDLAQGDIVCWLNSDDCFCDTSVIEKVVGLFQAGPHIDLISGDGYYVDEKLNIVAPFIIQNLEYKTYTYMKIFDGFLQPSTFWRKNNIRLDESFTYAFDWKYFLEYYRLNKNVLLVRDRLSCYRLHGSSKTVSDTAKRKKEIIQVLKANDASTPLLLWNYFIYLCYSASECVRMPFLKTSAATLNYYMSKFTNMRIHSC